jgi:hypothetical protein
MAWGRIALLAALCLAGSAALSGQGRQTGTLTGVVTDSSGAALPGTSVAAASPSALATRRRDHRHARGYRLTGLAPGTCDLTVSLNRFKIVRRNRHRSLNLTRAAAAEQTCSAASAACEAIAASLRSGVAS